jgi:hypothetical protein
MVDIEFGQFVPPQGTADQQRQDHVVPLPFQGRAVRDGEQLSQNPTRISEIAQQNGDTKSVVIAPVLSHKCKIGLGEREQANQLSLVFGESQQLKAFCRSKKLATGHGLGCSENGGFQDNDGAP